MISSRAHASQRLAPVASSLPAVLMIFAIGSMATTNGAAVFAEHPPTASKFLFEIKGTAPLGQVTEPREVAAAHDGSIYVVDRADHLVRQLTADGRFVRSWGAFGHADGRFAWPIDLCVGPDGTVYVLDGGNFRIQRFSAEGKHLGSWGSEGSAPGQFALSYRYYSISYSAVAIAAASDGTLYVADPGNRRVQAFGPDGAYSIEWALEVADPDVTTPLIGGIAVAPDASVYVVGRWFGEGETDDQVRRYDTTGALIDTWSGMDEAGQGVAVSRTGEVYVVHQFGDPFLTIHAPDGTLLRAWEKDYRDPLAPVHPVGIALALDGSVHVSDTAEGRIQRYSATGTLLETFGGGEAGPGQLRPIDVAFSAAGDLYVADALGRVQRFSTNGELVGMWGSKGSDDGEFENPSGITVAGDGTVYVSDARNQRVQAFDAVGTHIRSFGSAEVVPPDRWYPNRIAAKHDGDVLVVDSDDIEAFDPAGRPLGFWRKDMGFVSDLAVVPSGPPEGGDVIVLDQCFNRMAPDGTLLDRWDAYPYPGYDDCSMPPASATDQGPVPDTPESIPFGLRSVDGTYNGTVYVTTESMVRHFSMDGELIGEFGGLGSEPGQFLDSFDVAVVPEGAATEALAAPGSIVVADIENERLQVFGATPIAGRIAVFDNRWLAGYPSYIRETGSVDYDWGEGPPAPGRPADGFSVRFLIPEHGSPDAALLWVEAQGGVRLWADERLLIDEWDAASVARLVRPASPVHYLRAEYNDSEGVAAVRIVPVGDDFLTPTPAATAPPTSTSMATISPSPTVPGPAGRAYVPFAER